MSSFFIHHIVLYFKVRFNGGCSKCVWVSPVTQVSVLMARAADDAPHIGHHPGARAATPSARLYKFLLSVSLYLSSSVLCDSDWE